MKYVQRKLTMLVHAWITWDAISYFDPSHDVHPAGWCKVTLSDKRIAFQEILQSHREVCTSVCFDILCMLKQVYQTEPINASLFCSFSFSWVPVAAATCNALRRFLRSTYKCVTPMFFDLVRVSAWARCVARCCHDGTEPTNEVGIALLVSQLLFSIHKLRHSLKCQ